MWFAHRPGSLPRRCACPSNSALQSGHSRHRLGRIASRLSLRGGDDPSSLRDSRERSKPELREGLHPLPPPARSADVGREMTQSIHASEFPSTKGVGTVVEKNWERKMPQRARARDPHPEGARALSDIFRRERARRSRAASTRWRRAGVAPASCCLGARPGRAFHEKNARAGPSHAAGDSTTTATFPTPAASARERPRGATPAEPCRLQRAGKPQSETGTRDTERRGGDGRPLGEPRASRRVRPSGRRNGARHESRTAPSRGSQLAHRLAPAPRSGPDKRRHERTPRAPPPRRKRIPQPIGTLAPVGSQGRFPTRADLNRPTILAGSEPLARPPHIPSTLSISRPAVLHPG